MTRPNETPRDYRDEGDIDESLDLIRVGPRKLARELYRSCLDNAYQQGRVDSVEEAVRDAGEAA